MPLLLRALLLCGAAGLAACSLVSLKSPERPLSARDLNARILTREYARHFIAEVTHCADDISAASQDAQVQSNALRWKIAAATESERAATRIAPVMALLDSWALASQ
ncbi:MAG TPA: chemotaxis protein, partial [Candidatus Dormibacteraeota bacterium]|nr:chemotaxis protein [Candidatus Dormibacteraeota bacterium]